MRKNSWLQKFLYFLMAVLGAYILYKSGSLLALENQLKKTAEEGNVQRSLEDSAMRTWASAYTAAVEGEDDMNLFSLWMSQIAPVFSYAVDQAESADETETDMTMETQMTDADTVMNETETYEAAETQTTDIETEMSILDETSDSGQTDKGMLVEEAVTEEANYR